MTEVDVEVSLGGVTVVSILDTTTGGRVTGGKVSLAGWSLRTTSTQASQNTAGQFNAPPANTTIASILLGAGEWVINWTVAFGGTPGAGEVNNLTLNQAAALISQSENGSTAGVEYPQAQTTVSIPAGGATIAVKSVLAGTAGSVYFAQITATPVSAVAIAEITSGGNPVAEISLLIGTAETHFFGSGGIDLQSDVTLTVLSGSMRGAMFVRLELPRNPDYPGRDRDSSQLCSARYRHHRSNRSSYRLDQGVAA
jgi:hypothetical protein